MYPYDNNTEICFFFVNVWSSMTKNGYINRWAGLICVHDISHVCPETYNTIKMTPNNNQG